MKSTIESKLDSINPKVKINLAARIDFKGEIKPNLILLRLSFISN
jgi:hypothetical protein